MGRWSVGRQQAQKRFVLHRFALDMISLYSLHYIIAYYLAWIWLCMVCVKNVLKAWVNVIYTELYYSGYKVDNRLLYVRSVKKRWMDGAHSLSLSPSLFSEPTIFPLKGIYSRRRTQRKRWCPDLTRYTITQHCAASPAVNRKWGYVLSASCAGCDESADH